MKANAWFGRSLRVVATAALATVLGLPVSGRVFDDFNSGKSGWEDFSFDPALPLPQVEDGQFKFVLPPVGQPIFIASTKTTETFELKEGRSIEFRVDLVQGGAKDSFAILAFIPTATGASTLAGYGLAKSTTDVLITKGIGKYFYNEDPPEPIANENVALSLTLTAIGGHVRITGRILDLSHDDAVLFEKTVIDTPAADVMADGTDEPAAPFITEGRVVLYLYEDFDAGAPEDPYQVTFDNAEVFVTDAAVLDDFASGKSGWEDFSFDDRLPLPAVVDGQFQFVLPPIGQSIFIASTKTTPGYELREGERLELRVDLVQGGGKDSFAIVAFIPTGTGAGTLAGYGSAKSTTDVLLTKGIGKYFYNENPPNPVKNENITLSLTLTARGGRVWITGRVLDRDDNDAVLFEKTVVDTPAADVMADGTDDPAAPFITQGNFVLYLYEDFDAGAPEDPYQVIYDNAIVASAPVAGNQPPVISGIQPASTSSFLPASTTVSFSAADDSGLPDEAFSIDLNGVTHTTLNGLVVGGTGPNRTATLTGVLQPGRDYAAVLRVVDAGGLVREQPIHFDTFAADNTAIEIEDYNFSGGQYFNNPVPTPEGSGPSDGSYSNQEGVRDTDYSETRETPNFENTVYRTTDPVRMAHSLDRIRQKFTAAGGSEAGVYDYDVGDIEANEWMQYTRDFAPGTYEVYLREQVVNMPSADSVLERVTGDPTQPHATTQLLGTFLGSRRGFDYQNVPLTDGSGVKRTVVRLNGVATLRLRHLTGDAEDGNRLMTYLLFNPVPDPGTLRPIVTSSLPAPNSTIESVAPMIEVSIENADTTVNTGSIRLLLDGTEVANPEITPTASGAMLRHPVAPLPPSGSTVTATVVFADNEGQSITNTWQFVVTYRALDPAHRLAGTGVERGFQVRVVQAPLENSPLENTLDRAERQLAPNSPLPRAVDTNAVVEVINFDKLPGNVNGQFEGDFPVPGIDADLGNGNNDFAVEILTHLELSEGVHRFGVITDDGYKISVGRPPIAPSVTPIAFHNGGPANETFDFVVSVPGLYAFRMVWYERAGSGHAEWFSVNPATDDSTLINDPNAPGSIKAWRTIEADEAEVVLESAPAVTGPFQPDPEAVVNATVRTVTVPAPSGPRFFRLRSGSALRIQEVRVQGSTLVLEWQ
jgi:hypothetical protein